MGSISKEKSNNNNNKKKKMGYSFDVIEKGTKVLYHNSKIIKDDKDQYWMAEIYDLCRKFSFFVDIYIYIYI